MKKIFFILILLVVLASFCFANPVATASMKGLNFVDPKLGKATSEFICVLSGPLVCAEQKLMGMVTEEAMGALKEAIPEAYEAVVSYNKIKGYTDKGANIVKELEIDENGAIDNGEIEFKDQARVGSFISKDLKDEEVVVSKGISFDKEKLSPEEEMIGEVSQQDAPIKLKFKEKGGFVKTKEGIFNNVALESDFFSEKTSLEYGGQYEPFIEMSPVSGEISSLDLVVNKDSTYTLGNQKIAIPAGGRIKFNRGDLSDSGLVELELPGGSSLSEWPILINSSKEGAEITIKTYQSEEKIGVNLPNGLNLREGELKIGPQGTYVQEGSYALLNDFEVFPSKQDAYVYSQRPGGALSKNYVIISKNSFSARTEGELFIGAIPGNEFLRMQKWDRSKNPPVLIPDDLSLFNLGLREGAEVLITRRETQGEVPLLEVPLKPKGTIILASGTILASSKNGGKDWFIEDKEDNPVSINRIYNGVGMEIRGDKNIVFGSGNKYEVRDSSGKFKAGNTKSFELTNKISDNLIKTTDDLKFLNPKIKIIKQKEKISVSTIQTVNQWLKKKPGVEEYIKGGIKIGFPAGTNPHSMAFTDNGDESITIPAYFGEETKSFETLDHELQHRFENGVFVKESSIREKLSGEAYNEKNPKEYQEIVKNWELAWENSFDNKMDEITKELEEAVVKDSRYLNLKGEIAELAQTMGVKDLESGYGDVWNIISKIDSEWNVDLPLNVRQEMDAKLREFEALVKEKTGVRDYAFLSGTYSRSGGEMLTTFVELTDEEKMAVPRKNAIRLAQARLDMVHSLDNPPFWLMVEAEKDCKMLKGVACTPCQEYTFTCDPRK